MEVQTAPTAEYGTPTTARQASAGDSVEVDEFGRLHSLVAAGEQCLAELTAAVIQKLVVRELTREICGLEDARRIVGRKPVRIGVLRAVCTRYGVAPRGETVAWKDGAR